jgi:glycosyltransferase involved in cell wall biosynthesis
VKQLLAVSWEMPPLSGPRAVQVTRTLTTLGEFGWTSRVICFDPASDRYQQDYRVPVETRSAGMVTRLPVRSPEEWLLFRALWRVAPPLKHLPDEKRVWMPAALAEGRRALKEMTPDVLVSFAMPWTNHLIALELHRESGVPWVAHFSDPWIDSPYQQGAPRHDRRRASMQDAVIREASAVVFVNQQTLDRVMSRYPGLRPRAHVVPQGFESLAVDESPRSRPSGALRIVYTGRFYDEVRTPDAVLDAIARLNRVRALKGVLEVEFVGSAMAPYVDRSRQLGLDGIVSFPGRLSPEQARARAATADVLLTIDAPSEGPSLFLPSKLIDYLPFGKPLMALTPAEGPSADLLRRLGYPVIDPADVEGTVAALTTLIDRFAAGELRPSPQHQDVAAEYEIHHTTRMFEAVLESLATETQSHREIQGRTTDKHQGRR